MLVLHWGKTNCQYQVWFHRKQSPISLSLQGNWRAQRGHRLFSEKCGLRDGLIFFPAKCYSTMQGSLRMVNFFYWGCLLGREAFGISRSSKLGCRGAKNKLQWETEIQCIFLTYTFSMPCYSFSSSFFIFFTKKINQSIQSKFFFFFSAK